MKGNIIQIWAEFLSLETFFRAEAEYQVNPNIDPHCGERINHVNENKKIITIAGIILALVIIVSAVLLVSKEVVIRTYEIDFPGILYDRVHIL